MSSESFLLTKEVKDKLYEIFKMFATKKEDSFGVKELSEITKSYGMDLNEEDVRDMIAVADKTGDGRVTFEEFASVLHRKRSKKHLRAAFRVFDKESNGFIPIEEFRKVMTETGNTPLTPEEFDEMLHETGQENSSRFYYEEFIRIVSLND